MENREPRIENGEPANGGVRHYPVLNSPFPVLDSPLFSTVVSSAETRHHPAMADHAQRLRALPSVDRVLGTADAAGALARFQRAYVTQSIRAVLDDFRQRLAADAALHPPS